MKKIILSLVLFVVAINLQAQEKNSFSFKYMAGTNKLMGDLDSKINFSNTFSLEKGISKSWGLQSNFARSKYSSKTKAIGNTFQTILWETDLRFKYNLLRKHTSFYFTGGLGWTQFTSDLYNSQGIQIGGNGHENPNGSGVFPGWGSGINGRTLEWYPVFGFGVERKLTKSVSCFVNHDIKMYDSDLLESTSHRNKINDWSVVISFGLSFNLNTSEKEDPGNLIGDFSKDPEPEEVEIIEEEVFEEVIEEVEIILEPEIVLEEENPTTGAQKLIPLMNENQDWGYVDIYGNVIRNFLYDFAEPFVNGAAAVGIRQYKRNMCWHIDSCGNLLYSQTYFAVSNFSTKGYAVVKEALHSWVIIDLKGKEIAAFEGLVFPIEWNHRYLDSK